MIVYHVSFMIMNQSNILDGCSETGYDGAHLIHFFRCHEVVTSQLLINCILYNYLPSHYLLLVFILTYLLKAQDKSGFNNN